MSKRRDLERQLKKEKELKKERSAYYRAIYRERYYQYRELGFSSKDSKKLMTKPIIELSDKNLSKIIDKPLPKLEKKEVYKIRYQILRDLGYTSKQAQKLRGRKLNVKGLEYNKETNTVVKNDYYKTILKTTPSPKKLEDTLDRYNTVVNDTVYSTRWGMLTHDKRYKFNTISNVNFIKNDLKVSVNQAYYFMYFMLQQGLSYEETKKILISSKEFEIYEKAKNRRKGSK